MTDTISIPTVREDREVLLTRLYEEAFPAFAQYVARRGGDLEMAKDLFHDALVIWYERTVAGKVPQDVSDKAYLLGIARHGWLRAFRTAGREVPLEQVREPAAPGKEKPVRARLLRFLEVAGRKCMELLRAFYYDNLPADELAAQFGYSGARSATVQKYKCLEKVRDEAEERALQYGDFLE